MRRAILAAAISLMALASSASAASLYVATTGDDLNAGTLAAPLRTITKASKVALPGDVVNVRGGTYGENVSITSRGTAAGWITFRPYGTEKVIVDGTGSAPDTTALKIADAQYVELRSFEVRNGTKSGIHAIGSDHVRLIDNVVHHNQRNGISVSHPEGGVSVDITITGNTVYNNCLENQYHTASSGWGQAIGVFRTDGVTISRNLVYQNHGEGIDFILSDNGVATSNEVYDNYSSNVYLDNAQQMKIDRNLLYTTYDATYYRQSAPAKSIAVGNEVYEIANLGTGITVTNNIVIGGRVGFYHTNSGRNAGLSNTTVANNTFYAAEWAMIRLDTAAHTNTRFSNNVFYQTGGGTMVEWPSTGGVTFDRNNWYGAAAGKGASTYDVIGDPRLVNAGTNRAADYKLTALSPLLLKGASLGSLVTTDYFGAARAAALDIGAHQFSAAILDTTAPSAPGNLTISAGASHQPQLAWAASTDDVGVTGYRVLRNGVLIGTALAPGFVDPTVEQGTLVTYAVRAIDAAGNQSTDSNAVSFAWNASESAADTVAPTAPSTLELRNATAQFVAIAWVRSTDESGVAAYDVVRDGVRVAVVRGTQWVDENVSGGTLYRYEVFARDAAGNRSAGSGVLEVRTASARRRSVR